MNERFCERCAKPLKEGEFVWLELDQDSLVLYRPKKFPEGAESQGLFAFGKTCAKKAVGKQWGDGWPTEDV